MKKSTETLAVFFLFCVLEIIFWYFALLPDRTLYLRDISTEIIPKRFFWAESGGFALWTRFGYFGMPYAANPQSQAFYPFNFFYLLWGAERGLVFYVVFHHLLFLFTFYLGLRRLGFGPGAGLTGAIAFGFGGFFCSLTLLIVLLSTVAWFPLILICLSTVPEKGWLRPGLLVGPLVALQVLAGEIEMAGMSWGLAFLAVMLAPKNRLDARQVARVLAALGLGIFFGMLLSWFQLALTWEMIPISNRARGFSIEDVMVWSFHPLQMMSVLVPNSLFPVSASGSTPGLYWGLGFFSEFPYFLSFYIGAVIVLPFFLGIFKAGKMRGLAWLLVGLFALLMSLGENLPVYGFFCRMIPWFKMFRFPVKFYFIFSFALVMLGCFGIENLVLKNRPLLSIGLLVAGAGIALYLLFSPVRPENFGDQYDLIQGRLLFRSIMRVLCFMALGAGLIFGAGGRHKQKLGLLLALLCFADLFIAHRWLNPPIALENYRPGRFVREFSGQDRPERFPARILTLSPADGELNLRHVMDPLELFVKFRDGLENFWPVLFGLSDYRAYSSFHVADILIFTDLIDKADRETTKLIMARAGIEYLYYISLGFVPLSAPFPRAMVFYQAAFMPDRMQVIKLWTDPNFDARGKILLEGNARSVQAGPGMMSKPAEVVEYENERVVISADADREGWLMLQDAYYPGWTAEVDGKPVEIYRADGFFRAVELPAGKHRVVFSYHPKLFYESLWLSASALIAWFGLIIFSFTIRKSAR